MEKVAVVRANRRPWNNAVSLFHGSAGPWLTTGEYRRTFCYILARGLPIFRQQGVSVLINVSVVAHGAATAIPARYTASTRIRPLSGRVFCDRACADKAATFTLPQYPRPLTRRFSTHAANYMGRKFSWAMPPVYPPENGEEIVAMAIRKQWGVAMLRHVQLLQTKFLPALAEREQPRPWSINSTADTQAPFNLGNPKMNQCHHVDWRVKAGNDIAASTPGVLGRWLFPAIFLWRRWRRTPMSKFCRLLTSAVNLGSAYPRIEVPSIFSHGG